MTNGAADFPSRVYLLFVILGGLHLVWFVWLVLRARASADWPTTEARVLSSHVEYVAKSGYGAYVYYAYSVGGQDYVGKRLRFAPPYIQTSGSAQQDAREYPPGGVVKIAYNPSAPNDSVIDSSVSTGLGYCIMAAICVIALGIAGFLWR